MNELRDVEKAVAHVAKRSNDRTAIVREYLDGRVDVGPPILGYDPGADTITKGRIRLARPGWNRVGAELLHRRALFVSELTKRGLWP